jgi:hypothetical protein
MKIAFIQKIKQLSAALATYFAARPAPEPARCHNIKQLVHHLCDYDTVKAEWLLRWLAYPLRNPGAKMDMAVLATGYHGTGLSMLFERVMARLYEHSAAVIDPSLLTSQYNNWAYRCRFVLVDGDLNRHQMAQAKSYLTSRTNLIQANGMAPVECYNRLNFVFMTSYVETLPDHLKDRRFFLLDAPPPMSHEFYRAIAHEIENGGDEAFGDYLMRDLDMGDFDVTCRAPEAYKAVAA